jgi:predicted SprT family Zn-dependent metalloprotease
MFRRRKRRTGDRWVEDNRLAANPAAYMAVAGIVLAVAGLFVLFYVF